MLADVVRFFKECYRADKRGLSLWNVFAKSVGYFRVVDELSADLDTEYAGKLRVAIMTYRREKTLLLGSCFVCGRVQLSSGLSPRKQRICAPLLLHDAELVERKGSHYISVDSDRFRWNHRLLSVLLDTPEDFAELDACYADGGNIAAALDWLRAHSRTNIEAALEPSRSLEDLRAAYEDAPKTGFRIYGGQALMLAERAAGSRGVVDELQRLADTANASSSLREIFGQSGPKRKCLRRPAWEGIPGLLSRVQKRALQNAAEYGVSMLVGPPGTGKSYSIACMVLASFLRGESVLVVSENEHAVDIVRRVLTEHFGVTSDAIVRAGTRDYLKQLKTSFEQLSKGLLRPLAQAQQLGKLRSAEKRLRFLEKQFRHLQSQALPGARLMERAAADGLASYDLYGHWKLWRLGVNARRCGSLSGLLLAISEQRQLRDCLLVGDINHKYYQRLSSLLSRHRKELLSFSSALRASCSSVQAKRFADTDFKRLLAAMPIWLSSLSGLHKALPLKRDLFDLVIIDEATQADLASCIPALYRAERAVIVGDPKQLRHISFLSRIRQEKLRQKNRLEAYPLDLDYRDKSMIDFADQALRSQDAVVVLDEHYRSSPEIIAFSNREFYGGKLRIMTQVPQARAKEPIELIHVVMGQRKGEVNEIEAQAVVAHLRQVVQLELGKSAEFRHSIGVLSFFSAQAERLQALICENFTVQEIESHQLRAGTPYAFQGEEREIMLISCTVDAKSSAGTYTYLNRPDVFNVSVTRARYKQYLFLSLPVEAIHKKSLLYRYLQLAKVPSLRPDQALQHEHPFLDRLIQEARGRRMAVMRDYEVAGFKLDLVLSSKTRTLGINLVGFPGSCAVTLDLDSYQVFARAGFPVIPISYVDCQLQPEQLWRELTALLDYPVKSLAEVDYGSGDQHWLKLLKYDPAMAKLAQSSECCFREHDHAPALAQVQQLIDSYLDCLGKLKQQLAPTELTYIKYSDAAKQVLIGCLQRLKELSIELQLRALEQSEDSCEESVLAQTQQAILYLRKLSIAWEAQQGDKSDLAESLTELVRLLEKVGDFSGSSSL